MKCLSVKDPWAALIAMGKKTVELRTWRVAYRGPLIIIASAARSSTPDAAAWAHIPGRPSRAVAIVELYDVRPAENDDAIAACCPIERSSGYAWDLRLIKRLDVDLHVRGSLSLFQPPVALAKALKKSDDWL